MTGLISRIVNLWSPTSSEKISVRQSSRRVSSEQSSLTVQTADIDGCWFEYSGTCAAFHNLVIGRIYHEDKLFATRANVLLAVHAFLMTAFAILMAELMTGDVWNIDVWKITGSSPGKVTGVTDPEKQMFFWALAAALALFGALLGIFQAAMGRQTSRAIGLWREYARLIEVRCGIPFDRVQYEFYAHARVETPFGTLEQKDTAQKSLYQMFNETRFTTSTVCMIGIILPASLALFWASVFGYAINWLTGLAYVGIIAALPLLLWGTFLLRPGLAQARSQESQPEPRT